MGSGGEIFILEMGEPIYIYELAKDLIHLSGLKLGEDIDVVFTGMRPGEKLFEEILTKGEGIKPTHHPSIVVGQAERQQLDVLDKQISTLVSHAKNRDEHKLMACIRSTVPEYTPDSGRMDTVAASKEQQS